MTTNSKVKGGLKMNKTLVLTVLLGALVLMAGSVLAQTTNQNVQTTILADLTLYVNPNPLVFPPLTPDNFEIAQVELTAASTNLVVVGITATPVVGTVLTTENMQISIENDGSYVPLADMPLLYIANGTPRTVTFLLNVPTGTQSGPQSGVITYTVMEDI